MAAAPGQLRVGRYFLALAAIFAILYAAAMWPGDRHTPRLGIDLVGGTQVTFTARAPHGQTPSASAMNQAKAIMENRVNGTGVTEATVVVQGTDQIVVSIPGGTNTDVARLGEPAVLNFRGVVAPPSPTTCTSNPKAPAPTSVPSAGTGSASASPSPSPTKSAVKPSASTKDAAHRRLAPTSPKTPAPTRTPLGTASTTPGKSATTPAKSTTPAPGASGSGSPAPSGSSASHPAVRCVADPLGPVLKADPKLAALLKTPQVYQPNALSSAQLQEIAAALGNFNCDSAQDEADLVDNFYVACDYGSQYGTNLVYLLGPVIVKGSDIDSASAQAPNLANGGSAAWTVQLNLKSGGDKKWGDYTGAHNIGGQGAQNSSPIYSCSAATTPCADYVAFTLNGRVISAPVNETTISGTPTQISGNFSQKAANDLADQLKYGALPLSFRADTAQHVSATLGTSQLHSSFLAGGIGLALVVLYSLIYYRALGIVTIASLVVSAGLVYASIVFLGRHVGFTLDLAGIAGFIVALGITADSFVVFFERLKDEVHEGRSVRVAVPRAWVRARRTILSADAVSFLAAAVLYYFASAEVKGFAFTLGMSTILDLVVVFLFTHPLLSLLSRSRAFGSPRFTGLDALRGVPAPASAPARPSKRIAAAGGGATSAVAVLAKEDVEDEVPADDAVADEAPSEPEQRRRTTPQAGTAAERAAARRARMRKDGDSR